MTMVFSFCMEIGPFGLHKVLVNSIFLKKNDDFYLYFQMYLQRVVQSSYDFSCFNNYFLIISCILSLF